MFRDNKYNFSAFMFYMAMFLHGMQAIILSQNADYFAEMWKIDQAEVLGIIAWTGVGKIGFQLISGPLSDKIGRKPVALAGVVGYIISFSILLLSRSLELAIISTILGGAATSLFDGSVYPGLMEIYPNHKSTASILNKAFISISGIGYPLVIGFLLSSNASRNIGVLIPLIASIAVFFGILISKYPEDDFAEKYGVPKGQAIKLIEESQNRDATKVGGDKIKNHNKWDFIFIVCFSFFIYSTFFLFQQVSSIYASDIVGMDTLASRGVTSIYQTGALASVIFSSLLMSKGIRDMALLVIYPLISSLAAMFIYLFPSSFSLTTGAFIIGFTAAGGVLQLGNSILNQFFSKNKGRNTSLYYLVMSTGALIMPKLAASLKTSGAFSTIMLVDSLVAFFAFLIMFFIAKRYKLVFGKSVFTLDIKNSGK